MQPSFKTVTRQMTSSGRPEGSWENVASTKVVAVPKAGLKNRKATPSREAIAVFLSQRQKLAGQTKVADFDEKKVPRGFLCDREIFAHLKWKQ